jgi:hypothetical protein
MCMGYIFSFVALNKAEHYQYSQYRDACSLSAKRQHLKGFLVVAINTL